MSCDNEGFLANYHPPTSHIVIIDDYIIISFNLPRSARSPGSPGNYRTQTSVDWRKQFPLPKMRACPAHTLHGAKKHGNMEIYARDSLSSHRAIVSSNLLPRFSKLYAARHVDGGQ
ncbi:hypothetical protein I7I50_05717 [Histoplasma capsulatum G186AR]|uniref:Uncharacterized protein n=1 Tax=Ajellomyces capsulatus TaxID=5037 RepID=A0A8H7Z745_AJECA|nr:hypothetical protein I7I52_03977 [Histoplasma capsulatum]QSS76311.1 hypothetical protein I7I50_05717 [Histoplasma capsulatum G186AR]